MWQVEVGGQVDVKSRYVAPTLISGVKHDSKIMAQEIFGEPTMQAQPYTSLIGSLHLCGHVQRTRKPPLTPLASCCVGPLLPVLEVSNVDEAIAIMKQRPNPLALYVFSAKRCASLCG